MKRPSEINILGVRYQVTYVTNPAEVDIQHRQSLWGQYDPWTRTIRVYANQRPEEDIWQTVLHEVLHAIADLLHLKALTDNQNHDELDLVALAFTDVIARNGWMTFEGEGR
jgi:hypothetical protein